MKKLLILTIFLITFFVFAEENKNIEKNVSIAKKIFFCEKSYNGPANLGWCSDGTYYGPLHLGSVAIAGANDFYGGIQIGGIAGTNNFYGIGQIGIIAGAMPDKEDKKNTGIFKGFFQLAPILAMAGSFYGGFQMGGVASADNFYGGFQMGLVAYSDKFRGIAQIGGLNAAKDFVGIQLGIYNTTGFAKGLQVGIVNHTRYLKGVQIGLLNFATGSSQLKFFPIINIGY